jgi:glucose-6-phosphate-specific signal transduction histidine kinase
MAIAQQEPNRPDLGQSTRRDALIIIVFAATVGYLAGRFEINERIYAFTRHWERLQLDEWPLVVFALALGLAWFSWRRYVLARAELVARALAEEQLAEALAANRELAQQHVLIHDAAQKHLARELHDELGQYTNAIKLDAVAIQGNPECRCSLSVPGATRILEAVNHMHAVVSDIVRRLRPAGLDELGLQAALEQCVSHWQQRMRSTSIALSLDGTFDQLDELITLTLYRLIQEGLTNVSKHSGAHRVDILLRKQRANASDCDRIILAIGDDGCGASTLPYRPGFGLNSMRERVEMLGGTFAVITAPEQGFTIAVTLPARNIT